MVIYYTFIYNTRDITKSVRMKSAFFNAVHYIIIEQEWPGKVRVTGISVDFKQLDHCMYYIFPLKTIVILPLKFHHKAKYTLQRVEQ